MFQLGVLVGAQRMPQRLQAGLRLRQALARLQPPHHSQPVRIAVLVVRPARGDDVLGRHGHEDVGRLPGDHAVKAGRGDADNGEGLRVEQQRLAQHARIGAQLVFPVVEADHGHRSSVELIVGRHDQPAHRRLHAQHLKVIAGDQFAYPRTPTACSTARPAKLRRWQSARRRRGSCRASRHTWDERRSHCRRRHRNWCVRAKSR